MEGGEQYHRLVMGTGRLLNGHAGASGPSWLPADPSTRSMATDPAAGGAAHDEAMHAAHAHEDHSASDEGAATSHAGAQAAAQAVHGFALQPPTQRFPYHGTVCTATA